MHFPGTCRAGNTVILCPAATLRPRFRGSIRPSIRIEFGTRRRCLELSVFNRFFHWLESRVDPFPPDRPQMPPPGLLAFAWHYTKPFWPLLAVSMLFSAAIAFLEVYLFAFLGDLVDLLTAAEPRNLLAGPWHQAHRDGRGRADRSAAAELHFRSRFRIRACAAIMPCASAGRRTAMCCARAWTSSTTTSPAASPPR